jgi:Ni/Co efflux regulator RcnB
MMASFRRSSGVADIVRMTEDAFLRIIGEMRRLISVLAAAALVAAPLATAGAAMAGNDHHGGGREQGARGGGPRWMGGGRQGGPGYRGAPEYRYERPEGRGESRGEPRGDPRGDPRMNGYRSEPGPDPRYDPRAYGPPAPSPYYSAPRRGGYVGPGSGVIQDPGRYRLRPPPRGYVWMRTPNGMAMVSQSTGQIFDMVPNPY